MTNSARNWRTVRIKNKKVVTLDAFRQNEQSHNDILRLILTVMYTGQNNLSSACVFCDSPYIIFFKSNVACIKLKYINNDWQLKFDNIVLAKSPLEIPIVF